MRSDRFLFESLPATRPAALRHVALRIDEPPRHPARRPVGVCTACLAITAEVAAGCLACGHPDLVLRVPRPAVRPKDAPPVYRWTPLS